MAKTVAEIFIETLVNAGVRRVYGVVGDSLERVNRRHPEK
jgi:pyruvate dehydrogenase (quinone)